MKGHDNLDASDLKYSIEKLKRNTYQCCEEVLC